MRFYTTFPSEVKLSIVSGLWLHPLRMRIAMSTKTRNVSFDGLAHFHAISHKNKISGTSHCIIHIEWMLMKGWTD